MFHYYTGCILRMVTYYYVPWHSIAECIHLFNTETYILCTDIGANKSARSVMVRSHILLLVYAAQFLWHILTAPF